jgi:hypothetical protein
MRYAFIIKGNHQKKDGNPLPKLKMTGKQTWTEKAQNYALWKEHVVAMFLDGLKGNQHAQRLASMNIAQTGKPIVLKEGEMAKMKLLIVWNRENHGDPENIFGSIADALFHNDKHLDGEFCARHFKDMKISKGMVHVDIVITKPIL